jgi:hypothetical protein
VLDQARELRFVVAGHKLAGRAALRLGTHGRRIADPGAVVKTPRPAVPCLAAISELVDLGCAYSGRLGPRNARRSMGERPRDG